MCAAGRVRAERFARLGACRGEDRPGRLALEGRLTLAVSTAGGTGRHDAAMSICEALGYCPKLAVIVIGTTGRIALANKGRIDVFVRLRGKAAHSSTPWMGVDAIAGAQRVLERVLAINVAARKHPGLGEATLTPTAVRSWPEATQQSCRTKLG